MFLSPVLLSSSTSCWLFMISELWELFTAGHLAWKRSWKVTAYTCVLETIILWYYISVLWGKKAYYFAIIIVMCVYRRAYRTSFRVWFRLCSLLVGVAGPENCLQSFGIDVAWLTSFKVASSDVWTILEGPDCAWWIIIKFIANCAPLTQRILYMRRYTFDRPALPLSAWYPVWKKPLGPLVHSHNYINTRNNQYYAVL